MQQQHWQPLPPLQIESNWSDPLKRAFAIFAPQALWVASAERPVSVAHLAIHKVEVDTGYREVGIGHNRRPVSEVRSMIATQVENWVGGNPLRWQHPATKEDKSDYWEPKGYWDILMGLTGNQKDLKDRISPTLPKRADGVKMVLKRRIWTPGVDYHNGKYYGEKDWPGETLRQWVERLPEEFVAIIGDGLLEKVGWDKPLPDAAKLQITIAAMLRHAIALATNRTTLAEPYLDAGWLFHEERSEGKKYLFEERYALPAGRALGIKVWTEDGLGHFLDAAIRRSKAQYGGRAREHFREVCAAMLAEEREAEEARSALDPRKMSALGEPLWAPVARAEIEAVPVTRHAVRGRPRKYG